MKLAPAAWGVAATFALGLVGLLVPGPAGDIAAYAWLGLFPGLALVRLLLPGAPALTRWTLGLALSPLAASLAGWALLAAGQPFATAARIVAMAGWLLYAGGEARSLRASGALDTDAPADPRAFLWVLVAAAFVAIPLAISPWLRVRSDSWVHVGIVWEILERGIPPQDPRFAGLPLNYVWFYNLFVALVSALRPEPAPFTTMAVANACWIAVLVAVAWQLAWSVWRERTAARAALPLLLTGLNAGALALWPLWFLRALRGEVRGRAEAERILANAHWDRAEVMHQLSAPFAWMVNAWDKYMVGTALGYAYLLLAVMLWAGARWLGDPRERPAGAPPAWRWLPVAALAAAGMMLFHSVVGLSAIPVGVGACVLLAVFARRVPGAGAASRPLLLAGALVAGLAATWPYFRSIASGWDPSRSGVTHRYLQLDWPMPWTLVTACGLTAIVAWAGIRRVIAERRVAGLWLLAWTAGMLGFALVVHLPESNESKFVWQVFAPLALLGGAGLPALLAAWSRRLGRFGAAALTTFVFVLPSALLWRGFLLDPSGATAPETQRDPGEPPLYAWVREATPARAVFVDDHSRDVLLVEGRRRLLAGTPHRAERAAFPSDALARRRAVSADLYGPVADLAGDAAMLDSLGAPVYVLYRERDFPDAAPWPALEAPGSGFARVYAAGGFRVYRRLSP